MTRVAALLLLGATCAYGQEWPRFRGPGGQGHSSETGLPETWSATANVAWKTAIPGEGWSSPIVWADKVFVTTATEGGATRSAAVKSRPRTGASLVASNQAPDTSARSR